MILTYPEYFQPFNTINPYNGRYMDLQLDQVKIMQCKECGVDVPVNVNYPITEVTCQKCWAKKKYDVKFQKFLYAIRAGAVGENPPYPLPFVQFVQSKDGPGS